MKAQNINKLCIFLILSITILSAIVSAQEATDIYTITLNYKKQTSALSLVDIQKSIGTAPNYDTGDASAYRLDIVSADNKIGKSIKFSAPRKTTLFQGLTNENADNVIFAISVPSFSNAKLINIYDNQNKKVLEIPLESISDITATKPLNLNWLYIALPLLLIFGFLAYIEVKRKNDHKMLMQQVQQQSILTLKNYVTTNLRKGYGKEQIRNALVKNNYSNQEIEEAFKGLR